MTQDRRKFLLASGLGLGTLLPALPSSKTKDWTWLHDLKNISVDDSIEDEAYWHEIRRAFTVSSTVINLNNGGVSPSPLTVQQAVERYNQLSNEAPSYYMWRILDQGREPLRERLANLAGCSPDEIAINRNASEALETIIFGLRLEKGDEIVLTKQDYPNMINAWKQRAHRDGIVLKWINLELPIENESDLANQYINAFTSKTKIVHITHVINWTGQIIPSRRIADEAHKRGIEVLVDGAHSFVHIDFKIPDLGADYFGTSLHKWLCAPIGSGMLYVKKDKISKLYPLLAAGDPESEDIRKFENLGTRSFPIEQGIAQAIDFNEMLGMERKEKRLRFLKNYWCQKVNELEEVHLNTSLKNNFSCAIANISIKGKTPADLDGYLWDKHKIHTVGIVWENINGVRITPNVYTQLSELDKLVDAIHKFVKLK